MSDLSHPPPIRPASPAFLTTIVVVFGLGPALFAGGYYCHDTRLGEGRAVIVGVVREQTSNGATALMITTLAFRSHPSADPTAQRDVVLRFTQGRRETRKSWAWLATHDDCDGTTPDGPPPLGLECTVPVEVPLALVAGADRDRIAVTAVLEWAGARQDHAVIKLGMLYSAPEAP